MSEPRRRRPGWAHRPVGGVAIALSVMAGLLLWGRLKLVAKVPRTAYAEPESRPRDASPTGSTIVAGPEDARTDAP